MLLKIREEFRPALPGEHAALLILRVAPQVCEVKISRVVQVGDAGDPGVIVAQSSDEVAKVGAVMADLLHRVQPCTHALQDAEVVGIFEQVRSRPLLQLDHDELRSARTRVIAAEHDVGPFACQRQLVLHQRLDVLEPSVDQVARQHVEAPLPRPHLRRCR